MLRNFPSFWSSRTKLSRFEGCDELALLRPELKKIERQVTALKAAADLEGPSSLSHQKHAILSDFLNKTKTEIEHFNNEYYAYENLPVLPFMHAENEDFEDEKISVSSSEIDPDLKADLLENANRAYYYQHINLNAEANDENNLDADLDPDTVEKEKTTAKLLAKEKEPLLPPEMENIAKLNSDMEKLLTNLHQIRRDCLEANRETLNFPRNAKRVLTKGAIEWGPPVATVIGATVAAVTYGTGCAAVFGAQVASKAVSHAAGLNDERAWCVRLSDDWEKALNKTEEKIHLTLKEEQVARHRY